MIGEQGHKQYIQYLNSVSKLEGENTVETYTKRSIYDVWRDEAGAISDILHEISAISTELHILHKQRKERRRSRTDRSPTGTDAGTGIGSGTSAAPALAPGIAYKVKQLGHVRSCLSDLTSKVQGYIKARKEQKL